MVRLAIFLPAAAVSVALADLAAAVSAAAALVEAGNKNNIK